MVELLKRNFGGTMGILLVALVLTVWPSQTNAQAPAKQAKPKLFGIRSITVTPEGLILIAVRERVEENDKGEERLYKVNLVDASFSAAGNDVRHFDSGEAYTVGLLVGALAEWGVETMQWYYHGQGRTEGFLPASVKPDRIAESIETRLGPKEEWPPPGWRVKGRTNMGQLRLEKVKQPPAGTVGWRELARQGRRK